MANTWCLPAFAAGTKLEADLERAQKEIEQLRTDHDVAIERKDREVC